MKRFIRWIVGTMVPLALVVGAIALPAAAQDKAKGPDAMKGADSAKAAPARKDAPATKVILDNDQVRVLEVTFRPGDAGDSAARPLRVIHVIKGGTLMLHYPDGKTEKLLWKTGETQVRQATPAYAPKNEGKSDIVLLVVNVKEPKK